jgi:hypothetical protein
MQINEDFAFAHTLSKKAGSGLAAQDGLHQELRERLAADAGR